MITRDEVEGDHFFTECVNHSNTFIQGQYVFLLYWMPNDSSVHYAELMKSKDSKSTQRAVTRSIKLFRDFLI
jgi:hypothetical protein